MPKQVSRHTDRPEYDRLYMTSGTIVFLTGRHNDVDFKLNVLGVEFVTYYPGDRRAWLTIESHPTAISHKVFTNAVPRLEVMVDRELLTMLDGPVLELMTSFLETHRDDA